MDHRGAAEGPAAWPPGSGMAAAIRRHDWGATPLGPIVGWPESLRRAVELMLAMPQPAYVGWGPAFLSLYNDPYRPILGGKDGWALGRPCLEVFPEGTGELAPRLAAIAAGEAQLFADFPLPLESRPGQPMSWFSGSWTPLRDDAGAVAGFLGVISETTDKVVAEDALRASEARFRTLAEAIEDVFYMTDVEAGRLVYLSPACERVWGRPAAELPADLSRLAAALHPDDLPALRATKEAQARGESVTTEYRIRHPDGSERWVLDRCFPVAGSNGRLSAGIATDVTERRLAEATLRDGEERLSLVFQTLPVGVAVVDGEGNTLRLNEEMRRFLPTGLLPSRDAARRHRWKSLGADGSPLEPDDFPGARALRGEAVLPGIEMALIQDDGRELWTRVAAVPMFDAAGRIKGAFVVVVDTDEIKRAEERQRRSEERNAALLRFADAVRGVSDPAEIARIASGVATERLGTERTLWAIVDREARRYVAEWAFQADGSLAEATSWPLDPREPFAAEHLAGRTVAYEDSEADPRIPEAARAEMAARGIRAGIAVPVLVGGTLRAVLNTSQQVAPRRWQGEEVAFVEALAGRAWAEIERARAETALRESEERFRALAETAPALIWRNDAQGGNLFINRHFLEYTGKSAAEIEGEGWHSLVHPDDAEAYVAGYLAAVREAQPWRNRNRIRRHDGAWRWFENHAQPLCDAAGRYAGHVGVSLDITPIVEAEEALRGSEERQAFLLRLSDALRPLVDPVAVQETAARLTAEHLDIGRVAYAEIRHEPEVMVYVARDWPRRGMPSVADGRYRMDDFGPFLARELSDGRPAIVADAEADPRISPTERRNWAAFAIRASCALPVVKEGRFVAYLVAQDDRSHDWTEAEIALLREVSERVWASVERARAESAMRESEERYRTLFTAMDEGYLLADVLFDKVGRPFDILHVEGNGAAQAMMGTDPAGRRLSDISPDYEPEWYEIWGRVARTGRGERIERYAAPAGRWLDFYVFKPNPDDFESRRVAALFRDVTERHRREAQAAFLAELSGDFARLSTAADIMRRVGAKLGVFLNAARVSFSDVDAAADHAAVTQEWHRPGLGFAHAGRSVALADFLSADARAALAAGEALVVGDSATDARVVHAAADALGLRAGIVAPCVRGGQLRFLVTVATREARDWRADEVELVRELASRIWARLERARAEEARRESEERLRLITDAMPALIGAHDREERYAWVNEGFARFLGTTREALVGRTVRDVVGAAAHARLRPHIERALAGEEVRFEDREPDKHGPGRHGWTEENYIPKRGAAGEVEGYYVLALDITERKWAEQSLREGEERLRLALAIGGLATFDWDLRTGRVSWSSEHFSLYGYRLGEVEPSYKAWASRVHPEDLPGAEAALRQARETGADYRRQFRVVWPDRTVRWNDAVGRCFPGADGQPARLLGVLRDVTEARHAEAALRESEERFRQFGEASSDLLWIRDAETLRFEYLSPAFEDIYGSSRADILAGDDLLGWTALIHSEDREPVLADLERVRCGGRVTHEFRIVRPRDGEARWVENTDFPLLDAEGRVRRIAGIAKDVTESREAAERLKVLVAELQHRSRNLVGIVRAVSERTAAGSTTLDDFRARFRARLGALARVNTLLSRLGQWDRVAFDELLRTELEAHGVLDEHGRGTQAELAGPAGVRLRSSTVQTLALALHELATNALKYGALSRPEGRLRVRWEVLGGPAEGRRLRVEWTERGVAPDQGGGRMGYGRELIERALPYQLSAETEYEIGPQGVTCRITLPWI